MHLYLPGPAGRLEAVHWKPEAGRAPRAAAVFCHPHPLYGGTMNSNVVFRSARGLQQADVAVLRFNFRGAGRSQGLHDGQGGEAGDLAAALDWLAAQHPGLPLWAGGFSFGARTVAEHAVADERIERVALVALPVLRFDCAFVTRLRKPGLIVMAERDEFGARADLERMHPGLDERLEIEEIPGVGHFFEGATDRLTDLFHAWAERQLAAPAARAAERP